MMNSLDVAKLCDAASFPHQTEDIKVIETHISWVILTGNFAYKIKKPLNLPFVNFSDLSRRKHFCREELRLNRRYSPDIYLDVLPIREQGLMHIGGDDGPIVEYTLKMKQLPHRARLDVIIEDGRANPEIFFRLSDFIMHYHKMADVVYDPIFASASLIQKYINNIEVTRPVFEKELQLGKMAEQIFSKCSVFLSKRRDLFSKRQEGGFIRECHGDLHARNIYYTDRPYLIDCIEFNDDLRKIDIIHDFAFFIMDLEARGLRSLAERLTKRYVQQPVDAELAALISFYKCWMSSVRAMVLIMNVKNISSDDERAEFVAESKRLLRLSYHYANDLDV